MLVRIALVVIFSLAVTDYPRVHERVKRSGDVNFTYDSNVESTSDHKLKIVNSIKNDGPTPLSIKWPDAGISCTLFRQLKPGATDLNRSIAQQPYILDHADILFGNALQYSEGARCYVDGQTRPKNLAETDRWRQDQTGKQEFRIVVRSELHEEQNSAELTLGVEGEDFSLILPTRVGEEFRKFGVPKGSEDWKIVTPKSLSEVDIPKGSEPDIARWLGRTPQFKGSQTGTEFVVLKNTSRGNNEISFPITGSDWVLQTVYIVAYTPDKSGFIGLTADIHLPR